VFVVEGGISQPAYSFIRRHTGRPTDPYHYDYTDNEDEDAVVLEINIVDYPEKAAFRISFEVPEEPLEGLCVFECHWCIDRQSEHPKDEADN